MTRERREMNEKEETLERVLRKLGWAKYVNPIVMNSLLDWLTILSVEKIPVSIKKARLEEYENDCSYESSFDKKQIYIMFEDMTYIILEEDSWFTVGEEVRYRKIKPEGLAIIDMHPEKEKEIYKSEVIIFKKE